MNTSEAKRVLETALICATAPLTLREMRALFADELGPDTLRTLLDELVRDWSERGDNGKPMDRERTRNVMLVAVNGGDTWSAARIVERATDMLRRGVAPTPTFLEDARHVLAEALPTSDVPLLTDDYAPVDTMVF